MSRDIDSPTWFIPAKTVQLPDGSTLVKPGKAVQRGTASQVAKWTGVHRKVLAKLSECGMIRRFRIGRTWFYFPGDVEELIAATTADPSYWNEVRTKAYLSGKSLRSADARERA